MKKLFQKNILYKLFLFFGVSGLVRFLKWFFLKKEGKISIQMGYGENASDSVPYKEDNFTALLTNRGCDTQVKSPTEVKKDLYGIGFSSFEYWVRPTGSGDTHSNWIFFTVLK